MTTLQKAIVSGMLVILGGALLYQVREASALRAKVQTLERRQAPAIEQIDELTLERNSARSELTALRQENERLQGALTDIPRLRGELARLQKVANATQG